MVVDLPTRATRSEYASLLPFKRRTANPTALTMTIAITRTITLTLKAILKLLSQDMSGLSAKPGLPAAGGSGFKLESGNSPLPFRLDSHFEPDPIAIASVRFHWR
jgi:hypothetical protein